MIRKLTAILIGLALGLGLHFAGVYPLSFGESPAEAACCGGSSYQLNADVYEVAGYPSPALQALNPLTQKLKSGGRTVRYRYQVAAGCSDGNMRSTLAAAMSSTTSAVGVSFVEDGTSYDLTIRANCGTSFNSICGGGSVIACLGRGWPYVNDIDAVTTMATFYDLSQVSIWEHELAGHALSTWNEQYQLDGNFSASPGLIDFMNTGVDSRYDWPKNDIDRWQRTMWSLAPQDCNGPSDAFGNVWNPCTGRWANSSGWSFEPSSGIWYNPRGAAEWGQCIAADGDCWNLPIGRWVFKGSMLFDPVTGIFARPPN